MTNSCVTQVCVQNEETYHGGFISDYSKLAEHARQDLSGVGGGGKSSFQNHHSTGSSYPSYLIGGGGGVTGGGQVTHQPGQGESRSPVCVGRRGEGRLPPWSGVEQGSVTHPLGQGDGGSRSDGSLSKVD